MRNPVRLRVRALSLTEAGIIVESCNQMFKEDLRRANMELQRRVYSIQHTSTLSATDAAFMPAGMSSVLVHGGHSLPATRHETPTPSLTTDD